MKALIVRYSAIGDCVMAAHVPSRIRRTLPDAEIHWTVEDRCAPVVDDEILCQRKHIFEKSLWRRNLSPLARWRAQLRYFSELRKVGFDIGLDLQGHSKTALCLRFAKPNQRIAITATDGFARALNPQAPQPETEIHTVDNALRCLRLIFDGDADSNPIMPKVGDDAAEFLAQLNTSKPIATIAVGAAGPNKAYALENWAAVARELLTQSFAVAFLGGPGEAAPTVEGAIDLVGKLSLRQTMGAISASSIALAADTGAGHIAAAYGTPIVSVFGPMSPVKYRPYTDAGIVLHKGPSPNLVSPEETIAAAMELFDRYGRRVFDQ